MTTRNLDVMCPAHFTSTIEVAPSRTVSEEVDTDLVEMDIPDSAGPACMHYFVYLPHHFRRALCGKPGRGPRRNDRPPFTPYPHCKVCWDAMTEDQRGDPTRWYLVNCQWPRCKSSDYRVCFRRD